MRHGDSVTKPDYDYFEYSKDIVKGKHLSPVRRETLGSIPTSTKRINDIYDAFGGKILCLAAICAAG